MSDKSNRGQLSAFLLVAALVLLGAFRPLARLNHRYGHAGHCGLHQPALLAEPLDQTDGDTPQAVACTGASDYAVCFVSTADSEIVLKSRRFAFVPVVVRRLKLPAPASDPLPLL